VSCQAVAECWVSVSNSWSGERGTSVAQSSTGPWDDADVGVGIKEMTAPRG